MHPATSVTHLHILAVVQTELERVGASGQMKLLDAGCGDGGLMAYLQTNLGELNPDLEIEVQGFDVHDSLTEHAPSADVVLGNLQAISPREHWDGRVSYVSVADQWPFADGQFDVVISNQVIEHVADLDFFFGQLARTMRPGSFSVHVFPLRRVLYEWHLKMPIVHLIEDIRLRENVIAALSRRGIGTYPEIHAKDGIDEARYGHTRADFIQFGTFYRSWRELAAAAKHARLRATHRYTRGLYLQKLAAIAGREPAYRYSPETSLVKDWASFTILPALSTATILLEKPPVLDTWRRAGE